MTQLVELACQAADHGSFDTAVLLACEVGADQLEYAACRGLIGSVYRQAGRHRRAAAFDAEGMSKGPDDPLGRAMSALGAAADRVGVADLAGARAALESADAAVARVPVDHWARRWFDPWLTQAWVAAEVHLLADEPGAAAAVLEPFAVQRPSAVPNTRWPYERAKTWLFLGVAQRCAGDVEGATASLVRAARIAAEARLWPLLGPVCQQLAELDPVRAAPLRPLADRAAGILAEHPPPP